MFCLLLSAATVLVLSANPVSSDDSCRVCNCQFSNVGALIDLIKSEIRNTYYVPWTPVAKTEFGEHDLNTATTLTFTIPSVIPDTAQAVLLYATAQCGYSTGDDGADLSYYVMVDGTQYEHFLHMFAYGQDAFNTNSDNMWFPMPPNRQLNVEIPQSYPRNCFTYVSAIGYR